MRILTDPEKLLGRLAVVRRSGNEQFHSGKKSLPFNVLDFWRWSASDLISNTTRGILAEYIVARACGGLREPVMRAARKHRQAIRKVNRKRGNNRTAITHLWRSTVRWCGSLRVT